MHALTVSGYKSQCATFYVTDVCLKDPRSKFLGHTNYSKCAIKDKNATLVQKWYQRTLQTTTAKCKPPGILPIYCSSSKEFTVIKSEVIPIIKLGRPDSIHTESTTAKHDLELATSLPIGAGLAFLALVAIVAGCVYRHLKTKTPNTVSRNLNENRNLPPLPATATEQILEDTYYSTIEETGCSSITETSVGSRSSKFVLNPGTYVKGARLSTFSF